MTTNQNIHLQTNEPTTQSAERRYRLSPEEHRVLQECNRESFYYRSLPLAASAMVAVHLATRKGWLSSHPKWGSAWKLMGAGFVGWFVGKLSYQDKCAEKLMQLPNSHLAETLKRHRLGQVTQGQEQEFTSEQYSTQLDDTTVSEITPLSQERGAFDLFPEKESHPAGLEDRFRPSMDNQHVTSEKPEELPTPPPSTNYDELRKKNRESVMQPSAPNYPVYRSPSPPPPIPHKETTPSQSTDGTKNLYGDVWDN